MKPHETLHQKDVISSDGLLITGDSSQRSDAGIVQHCTGYL